MFFAKLSQSSFYLSSIFFLYFDRKWIYIARNTTYLDLFVLIFIRIIFRLTFM